MSPELLPAIAAFARVAHHASFTRAAAELGVSPSALSQTLRTLERRLGVRLLDRSTRRVGVTELGARFLADAEPALAALVGAVAHITEARDRPAGVLRLNLSRAAADLLLLPHLGEFTAAYPDVTLELVCDNNFIDLVAGGFDAGIRVGESLAQDVIAVPLGGPQRLVTFASPSYLQGRTPPATPAELAQHRCLNARFTASGALYRWDYQHADGRRFEVAVNGPLTSNDGDVLLAAARAGAGVGCTFEGLVQADFRAGRLAPLLEGWWPTLPGFHLYHPSRSQVPRKLRVFIDFFAQRLARTASSLAEKGLSAP
jgi:DNA-binding transcriptional LysR family regulator